MNSELKIAREKADLTQVETARKAKISERQYIRIEKATQEPKISTAIRIAQALGSTVEELFPLPRATIISIEKQQEVRK